MTAVVPQTVNEQGASSAMNLRHTWTDYCGSFIYENDTLKQTLIEGGYISYEYPQNTAVTSISQLAPTYHFYVQDHLGNNRLVVDEKGTIEQINHYYPYGGLMGESKNLSSNQRYKYNGKEFDRMHGLDWYDYGARFHDPATGRWFSVDQLAEDYSEISPYTYCANNPIIHVDKEGKFPLVANVVGAVVGAATEYVGQVTTNLLTGKESAFTDVDLVDIGISAVEGFVTCGSSSYKKGVKLGIKVSAELTRAAVDGNAKDGIVINDAKTTAEKTAVGLATGAVSIKKGKVNVLKTQTKSQAVKQARSKATSQGKKYGRDQYKQTVAKNKKRNAEKKEINNIITDATRKVSGVVDGTLKAAYVRAKELFCF